ncbi:MAG: M14 family zinc carboxypeptidase [Panacibacter sp.]
MKKTLLLTLLLTVILFTANAQQKYYRVQIFATDKALDKLAEKGIPLDHGEYKKDNYFISDFSQQELDFIKESKLPYKVLINDLSAYYARRSKETINAPEEILQAATTCANYKTPKNFKLGSMAGFYTYTQLLATLDSMRQKFPKLISVKQIVSSTLNTAEGRPLYFVKISNSPNTNQQKPQILYTALHHAREPESATQLIYYMWFLLENYKKDPRLKNLIDSTEMYFIPCLNPDGYIYNQTTNPNGGGLWRKNRRNNGNGTFGVDLNRNYGYEWGYDNVGSSPITSSDTYRGPSAFSENETQIMRDFANHHHFIFALNNHSYSNVIPIPFGYKRNTLTSDSVAYDTYASRMVECNGFGYGTPNQTVGYTANGVSDDWLYAEQISKNKVFAFSPETGSAIDGFWPATNRIIPLSKANVDMNLSAANFVKQIGYNNPFNAITKVLPVKNEAITIVQASPNPVSNYTYITFKTTVKNTEALQLNISNGTGSILKVVNVNPQQQRVYVNTADLQNGIYYFSIGNNKYQSAPSKLVVIK